MTESLIFHRGSLNSDQMRRFSFEIPDTVFVKWPYNVHCVLGMCSRNGLDGIGDEKEIPQVRGRSLSILFSLYCISGFRLMLFFFSEHFNITGAGTATSK